MFRKQSFGNFLGVSYSHKPHVPILRPCDSTPQCSVAVTQLHTCYCSFNLPRRDEILSQDCMLWGLNTELLNARLNMRRPAVTNSALAVVLYLVTWSGHVMFSELCFAVGCHVCAKCSIGSRATTKTQANLWEKSFLFQTVMHFTLSFKFLRLWVMCDEWYVMSDMWWVICDV